MTLLDQLDAAHPRWRNDYNNDALKAAVDLGLIEPEDTEPDAQALDFNDELANWRRVVAAAEESCE